MELLIGILVGYGICLIHKGIHIHYHQPSSEKEKEGYTESLVHQLPKEIQDYYQTTNGQNKF